MMMITTTIKERRARLLNHASNVGCDAVAAFEPENVFYLTGFWGEAIAVCTDEGAKLITPKLEFSRAEQSSVDCDVIPTERGGQLISTFVSSLNGKNSCADLNDYSTLEQVRRLGAKITVNTEPFFQTRRIKDDTEIRVITRAAGILDKLFQICADEIKAGLSERELQARLVYEAMKMGANPPSYKSTLNPLIIAGGPNGALPHAEVTGRRFRKKDMIVVDLTLRHEGYIADSTRTFAIGRPSAEMVKVYDIVRESQQAGLSAARAGASTGQVDDACRNLISRRGYEKYFIHSTGHGIGLDVHEPPWLRPGGEEILHEKVTVTVEPGIYLEGKFGVRIEDSIVVTAGRPKVLNRYTKELVVL